MPLTAGTKLGPYRIRSQIGAGGMGEVYSATDTRLDRTVAIKVLPEHLADDPQRRERFEREAKAISSLNHPHICALYDVGDQDGTHYLVMELVEGETLKSRLKTGRLPLDQVIEYAMQIADALDNAHRKGVVHRDPKPGNIMLTKSGVKVLDFGLARMADSGDQTLTVSSAVMGTPAYMAPEQFEGKKCDGRTDVYALGLVLHEAATGRRLARGERPALDGLPTQFAHVIDRCLAQDPDKRWQSASDVEAELQWAGKVPVPNSEPTPGNSAWLPWSIAALALGVALVAFLRPDSTVLQGPSEFGSGVF